MSTDTTSHAADATAHDAHSGHPSDATYVKVFLILFVVTAVEVALYYVKIPLVHVSNAMLGVLAIGKFAAVVAYFMHLKFDNRILRRLFITGLVLAVAVYVAYLSTLGVFLDPPPKLKG